MHGESKAKDNARLYFEVGSSNPSISVMEKAIKNGSLFSFVKKEPFFCGAIKTDEPRTLDFSGVRGFLVTNVCIVQRSAA